VAPSDVEQVRGVRYANSSGIQYLIVRRVLGFRAKTCRREPSEGMKPEQRAHERRDELREVIMSRNVRELVDQDDSTPFRVPVASIDRQHDDGIEKARRHWRGDLVALEDVDLSTKADVV